MILQPETHKRGNTKENPQRKDEATRVVHCLRPSLQELLHVAAAPVVNAVDRSSQETNYTLQRRTHPDARKAWFGGVDFKGAMELAQAGWIEGAAKVQGMSALISAPLFAQAEKVTHFDVAPGEWCDQDRFLSGQPEVWGEIIQSDTVVGQTRGKYVHVVVNGSLACSQCDSMNCMTEPALPKTLLHRAAMICSMVDVLESLGFRSKISMVYCCCSLRDNAQQKLAFDVKLKDYGGHLDMDTLMYYMGHPSALRRIVFSYIEHLPAAMIRDFNIENAGARAGTYGSISDDIPPELGLVDDDREALVYIPFVKGNPPQYATMEKARAECVTLLKKQGVMVEML